MAPDEYVVDTDLAGAFCIQTLVPAATRVALRFEGNTLVEASRVEVSVATAPAPALTFDPPVTVLHLDGEMVELGASLAHVDVPMTGWVLQLRDEQGNDLGQAAVQRSGRARWEVSTSRLSDPGAGEIIAQLEGPGAPPLLTRQRVERHARVEIDLLDPPPRTEYREGALVQLQVRSSRGPVPGGWVEARAGERTVVTIPVNAGRASFGVRELSFAGATDVELRYWPAAAWWEPGSVRTIRLLQGRHAVGWVRGALIGLALIVAGWMLRGSYRLAAPGWWRRARQARGERAEAAAAPRASDRTGRALRVADAHEGGPLVGALVQITIPAFPAIDAAPGGSEAEGHAADPKPRLVWSATTDDRGVVSLPDGPLPNDAVLRISSPLHVSATLPVPRAGATDVRMLARRRHLLERFARWAARELGPWPSRHEPTPRDAAQRARRSHPHSSNVDAWTHAVESAAFAAAPVDEHIEAAVLALEPTAAQRTAIERPER